MKITFSPLRGDFPRTLARTGDILTVDGQAYDFGSVQEGDVLSVDEVTGDWLAGDVTRTGGVLHLAVILPHGADAPVQTRFPEPVFVTEDGPVDLPPFETPV